MLNYVDGIKKIIGRKFVSIEITEDVYEDLKTLRLKFDDELELDIDCYHSSQLIYEKQKLLSSDETLIIPYLKGLIITL